MLWSEGVIGMLIGVFGKLIGVRGNIPCSYGYPWVSDMGDAY